MLIQGSEYILSLSCIYLIVPNGVHSKSLLRNVNSRHARQFFIPEAIHLDKSHLVIAQCQPFVTPIAWTHGVGMAAAGRRGLDEELALNLAVLTQLEGRDVAGDIEGVGSGGGEEILPIPGAEADIATVFVAGWQALII